MMKTIRIYQIDAFADKVFAGNPAAVCPLNQWLGDEIMQKIAMENNLAETAFYVKRDDYYEIRWFTPTMEVDLCGHATLSAAFVLFHHENHHGPIIRFFSPRSGELIVTKCNHLLTLNFPADDIEAVSLTKRLTDGFNILPQAAFKGKTDYMLVFRDENEIRTIIPNLEKIGRLDARGIIITAPGINVDFVSRFFAPQSGINEDPVTGSAHTTLIPYWAKQFGKTTLSAMQLSERQGHLEGRYLTDRIEISGEGKLFLKGEIYLD